MSAADRSRQRAAESLLHSVGRLRRYALARMEVEMPWFVRLSAADRSWVGLIVDSGIRGFVEWYRGGGAPASDVAVASDVFGVAPRTLTGVISLQQTVDLVRLSIDVVEENVDEVVATGDAPQVHAAVMRYAREVAFATAEVYARAAEQRGAWDARLEALLVDSVMRSEGDEALSRAGALGWSHPSGVVVVLGAVPAERPETGLFTAIRRRARAASMDAACAVQGERLVVVLGGVSDAGQAATRVLEEFGPGPVVVGPVCPDLSSAHLSAREAAAAYRAAPGWIDAPRPVPAADLLAERVLLGEAEARRQLITEVFVPLADPRGQVLVDTLAAFFGQGAAIEATSRALFVHPNTVRYRLRRVGELTGLSPTRPRHALLLQLGLSLGRLQRARGTGPADSPDPDDEL